jgi:ribosomal-protein-alanine N-acetyltransferase
VGGGAGSTTPDFAGTRDALVADELARRRRREKPAVVERRATLDDVTAIVAIEQATFSDPWSAASIRRLFEQDHAVVRVALLGRTVVGYGVVWVIGDEAELANLAVAAHAQRRGAGALLLDALLADVAAHGGATVHLEVRASNAAALALYTSRGFVESGRRKGYYSAPTEDALLMRRQP